MTKYSYLPYRNNVCSIVFKRDKFLIVQRINWRSNWWKFPQGGVDEGETEEEALRRELLEELGIKNIKIVGKSKYTNTYDWLEEVVIKEGLKYRGQFQKFYLVEFTGKESEIKIDFGEIGKFKWVSKEELFRLNGLNTKFSENETNYPKNYSGRGYLLPRKNIDYPKKPR